MALDIDGPHCGWPPQASPLSGIAANAMAARQRLTHSFEAWLSWALLREGPVHWHWTEAAAPVFASAAAAAEARAA